jgi:hypothetical protein
LSSERKRPLGQRWMVESDIRCDHGSSAAFVC